MSKYIIQDITPPEKKHRASTKSAPHVASHHTHHDDTKATHHTATTPHPSGHHAHRLPSRVKMYEPEPAHTVVLPDVSSRNPKTMIVDQLTEQEGAALSTPEGTITPPPVSTPPVPTSPETPISPQIPDATTTMGTPGFWPYNKDKEGSSTLKTREYTPAPQFPTYTGENSERSTRWLPWIIGILIASILGVLLLNFFSGATVLVIPKNDNIPMEQSFTAFTVPPNEELVYTVMKVSASSSREVPAMGTKTVTAKASGSIIIFNEQTVAQRLIKNTRFEAPTGKIYRINESITVPKSTTQGGKVLPGSLTVTVYADEAGPEYNSEPTDFTVPGLKNTSQYKKVYARSKGSLSGGAAGTIKSVSDQDLRAAGEELRVQLETKLRTEARSKLVPSQISYDPGILVEVSAPVLSSEKSSSEDKAVVTESGTLYMVVFDRAALTKAIAKALIPTYAGEGIQLANLEALTFSFEAMKGDDLYKATQLKFSLKGEAIFQWIVDEDNLKKSLLGISKENFNTLMTSYATVESAKAMLYPFWTPNFPQEEKNITIKLVEKIEE